jgi:predicted aspartyl protease
MPDLRNSLPVAVVFAAQTVSSSDGHHIHRGSRLITNKILRHCFSGMHAVAVVLLLFLTADGNAQPDAQPAKQNEGSFDLVEAERWIALERTKTPHLVVKVAVDGKIVPALLDTGAPVSVLDSAFAKSLNMEVRSEGRIEGFGGSAEYGLARFKSFAIGGYRHGGGSIGVVDLSRTRAATGLPYSVIVGSDLLAYTALEVDCDHRRLRILPSGSRTLEGTAVPLRTQPPADRFITTVSIDGHALDTAVVDTGADEMAIRESTLSELGLEPNRLTDIMAMGIGGKHVLRYFRVDAVQFGDAQVDRIPAHIETSVFPDPTPFQALIGMDLLRHFNFLIDPGAGHIIVAPRTTPVFRRAISTSGIQGEYRDDGAIIMHVMRGSPAAAAGLHDGDRVCAVDGAKVDATWQNSKLGNWHTDKPGRRVTLRLCDGREKILTLAEFY